MRKSVFKTNEMKDTFRDHYKHVLSQLPFEQRYINTSLGQTFMLVAGDESNQPIILLHGSCSNSAFWFPEIVSLSSSYRVYAVDIIGEAGNSDEFRPDLDSSDFAVWLNDVFDALNLDQSVVIGNSLGGWMALKFATAYPERVSQIVLLASAGIAEVRQQFISNVEQTRKEDGSVHVDSAIIGVHNIPKEVLDFMNLITISYNPIQQLPLFSDEALKRLNMPLLFIDGVDDAIIDAEKSAQRLSQLVPTSNVQLLENCGHVLTDTVQLIIPFLDSSK